MFSIGNSSSGADNNDPDPPKDPAKGKAPMTEAQMQKEVFERLYGRNSPPTTAEVVAAEEWIARQPKTPEELIQKEGLFFLPWDNTFPKEVRIQSLEYASSDEAKRFLQLTLIKNIQTSPCKLQILERWEKDAFQSFSNAYQKISECKELWLREDKNGEKYVDLCDGHLTWTSYNLILQYCRERGSIIICADPADLEYNQTWSGWTDVFLDTFCPRTDWENRRANFILHLKADLEVAHQNFQWFKFKLIHEGGTYQPLEHRIYAQQKFIRRSIAGEHIESRVTTREIPLDYKVESHFRGEFLCEPNPLFKGSDIERCFSQFLYPPPSPVPYEHVDEDVLFGHHAYDSDDFEEE